MPFPRGVAVPACRLIPFRVYLPLVVAWSIGVPCLGGDEPKPDPAGKQEQTAARELHVVGIYEGFTKSEGKIHGGRALVTVNRPGKQVTLVLVSYDPVTWDVSLGKDTKLEKVILGGSHRAAVKGIPERVEVVEAFRGAKNATLPFYTYKIETPGFRSLVEVIATTTGRKIANFTGSYRAEASQPIVVDSVQDDERFSADFPQPVPAAKLPKLTFMAHHYVSGRRSFEVSCSFGQFTLAGPNADTLKPLPARVDRITYDPAGKKYYGISDHGVAVIDMEMKTATKIEMGLDVPQMSWPADITFDTKRDRVLVTASTNGYLFAYYPKTKKWEVLAEKLDAPALTYHPKDDSLYALKGDGSGEMYQLNEKGAVIKTTKLDGSIVPGMLNLGPGVNGVQLVPASDKLVLFAQPVGLQPLEDAGPKRSYMYLIDQKTGKAQLTWKAK